MNNKLHAALSAVHDNRIILVEPGIIVAHAAELGYSIRDELQQVLLELLQHTGPEHYAGHRPPQKSYETRIHLLDLWAFSVICPMFFSAFTTSFRSRTIIFIWYRYMSVPVRRIEGRSP